jgi:hypothetical protein
MDECVTGKIWKLVGLISFGVHFCIKEIFIAHDRINC